MKMNFEILNLEPDWDINIDIPKLAPSDYTDAIEIFIEKTSKIEGAIGGFQFGSVKHPGISDLDLGVVVKDDCSDGTMLRLIEYKDIGDRASELILHSPLIIPESLVKDIFYTRTISNIQKLWGSTELSSNLTEDEKRYSDIANYIDWTYRAYEQSVLLLNSRRPSLRALFVALGKCEKSLKSAFWIKNKTLPQELLGIRNSYLNSEIDDDLSKHLFEVLKSSIALLGEYDLRLAEYLLSKGDIQEINSSYVINYFGNYYINFYDMCSSPRKDNILTKVKYNSYLHSDFETIMLLNLSNIYPAQFSIYSSHLTDLELKKIHAQMYPVSLGKNISSEGYKRFLINRAHYSSLAKKFLNHSTKRAWSLGLGTGFRWPQTCDQNIVGKILNNLKNREIRNIALHLMQD